MIMNCGVLFYMSLSQYLAFSAYHTVFEISTETPSFAIFWASLNGLQLSVYSEKGYFYWMTPFTHK